MVYLYDIFIKPIELIVEIIFVILYRVFGSSGMAIIGVSLVINVLILPIYRRADAAQEDERKKQEHMKPYIQRIHNAFRGDERYMILSTYYKEVGYHPLYALRGMLPVFLQIPFFIAAFHFLSSLDILSGESFGILKDLSKPDGLINLFGKSINILPLLMTLINVLSSLIYLKGFPLKSKLQTYGLAVLFLFLLYGSPSGLVFYWTLNNLFSFCKNIVMKLIGIKVTIKSNRKEDVVGFGDIIPAQICLTMLFGLTIPSALVAASPLEFILMGDYKHPIHYIASTLCIAIGYFMVWMSVFYLLSISKVRKWICMFLSIWGCTAVINYMFFGKKLGIVSADLLYQNNYIFFECTEKIINFLIVIVFIIGGILLWKYKKRIMKTGIMMLSSAMIIISLRDCVSILRSTETLASSVKINRDQDEPIFRLSKTGKNVMVICLDAAIGAYVPYILHEKPELKAKFDGFVFYPNTVSFGRFTSVGSQGVWGGYEYVPSVADLDLTKNQEEKRYEADTMLARLFSDNGYEVTACDIPYAGFQKISDPSAFNDISNVKAINTMGYYTEGVDKYESNRQRAFFMYSLMKSMPVILQSKVYDAGRYYSSDGLLKLSGGQSRYFEAVSVLRKLPTLTEITTDDVNTLLLLNNETSHEPIRLSLPDYDKDQNMLTNVEDESEYYREDDFGNRINLNMDRCYYHSNVSAYLRLADYFDFLRENNLYDNTRIIIVADHGRPTYEFPDLMIDDPYGLDDKCDVLQLNPVLMVKDFNAHGAITEDRKFMTNADTPSLVAAGIIDNPINPYTGVPLDSSEKFSHDQVIIFPGGIELEEPEAITYDKEGQHWISVHDDIFDLDNWEWIK
ncbi:MAG: membrane protein insertase YidC [Eubacterium sp.]|nr:membrane protein insertase YidC [Eubacterium sp.]